MTRDMLKRVGFIIAASLPLILFQNCSNVQFAEMPLGKLGVCDGVSCELTPLTSKPAVTTILLAIGDEADDQLVINGLSSQLLAETVIRYSSPAKNPKILVVLDSGAGKEDPEDTQYVLNLLKRYDTEDNVKFLEEPKSGLTASDVEGFDVIWFNNPGAPMGTTAARDVLLNFKGGVVLQGDDLSRGSNNFDLEQLTGLRYNGNGTAVTCNGKSYGIDNNSGYQYNVTLDASKFTGASESTLSFKYGNDIDDATVMRSDLEVLAYAVGDIQGCSEQRPAIVRYIKN